MFYLINDIYEAHPELPLQTMKSDSGSGSGFSKIFDSGSGFNKKSIIQSARWMEESKND